MTMTRNQKRIEANRLSIDAALVEAYAPANSPTDPAMNAIAALNPAIITSELVDVTSEVLAAVSTKSEAPVAVAESAPEYEDPEAMPASEPTPAKVHQKSTFVKGADGVGPTKRVWGIADAMLAQARANATKLERKQVLTACVAEGIARNTAQTQFQAWRKATQVAGPVAELN
jgi:hypothetical protein